MSYLHSNGDDENARLSHYNGMDLVMHEDILPYEAVQQNLEKYSNFEDPPPPPINNPHYPQIFNHMAMLAAADCGGDDPYLNGMFLQFKPEQSATTTHQAMLRHFNPM